MKRIIGGVMLLAVALAGCAGGTANETRTIEVTMTDDLRYDPDEINVSIGESVRFVVTNAGGAVHEFLIGSAQQQEVFEQEMADEHGGEHAAEAGVTVDPGQTAEFTYTFVEAGELLVGCHQPGHYDGGMVADLTVGS